MEGSPQSSTEAIGVTDSPKQILEGAVNDTSGSLKTVIVVGTVVKAPQTFCTVSVTSYMPWLLNLMTGSSEVEFVDDI